MRIQGIEITNYKAFLGTHKINVGGKKLFIYGKNGSGKSSLYYIVFKPRLKDYKTEDFWKVIKNDLAEHEEKKQVNYSCPSCSSW